MFCRIQCDEYNVNNKFTRSGGIGKKVYAEAFNSQVKRSVKGFKLDICVSNACKKKKQNKPQVFSFLL